MTIHPSEEEIQNFVLTNSDLPLGTAAHLITCKSCQSVATNYRTLFFEISNQPRPTLDFSLSDLVLPKLLAPKQGTISAHVLLGSLVFFVLSAVGLGVYVFKDYFEKTFSALLPMTIYLMAVPIGIVLILQVFDMFRKYKKQSFQLNSQL
jgi:hypothetical protein